MSFCIQIDNNIFRESYQARKWQIILNVVVKLIVFYSLWHSQSIEPEFAIFLNSVKFIDTIDFVCRIPLKKNSQKKQENLHRM